ncbi:tRNA-splicing endonuclease subunit SEN54 [Streptomyces misionensis JCM 4497]
MGAGTTAGARASLGLRETLPVRRGPDQPLHAAVTCSTSLRNHKVDLWRRNGHPPPRGRVRPGRMGDWSGETASAGTPHDGSGRRRHDDGRGTGAGGAGRGSGAGGRGRGRAAARARRERGVRRR